MNQLSRIQNVGPMAIRSFSAWRLSGSVSHPLDISCPATIEEAVSTVAPQCAHKDIFHVLERDLIRGKSILHVYAIKQGKRVYRSLPGDICPTWQAPLRAEPLYSMAVEAFEPAEPWRVAPGCDVVGRDSVINLPASLEA